MDENASEDEGSVDWNTDDELEVALASSSQPALTVLRENVEASSSSGGTRFHLISYFVGMGYPEKLVLKAVDENGDGDTDAILNSILTYLTLEESPPQEQSPQQNSDPSTSDYYEMDDLSEMDNWSEEEIEEKPTLVSEEHKRLLTLSNSGSLSEKEKKLLALANMGYTVEESSIAMDRCGLEASVSVLTDFILAAQMAREEDCYLPEDDLKLRRVFEGSSSKKRKYDDVSRKKIVADDFIRLPKPMIGFGTPSQQPEPSIHRKLPDCSLGPPYFYYENVALAPKGVWEKISRFLFEIPPEFVDSKYFSATARKRGYIHNLPIDRRFPLIPLPPMTIHQAFPLSNRWWPTWDTRDKLNCIQTTIASAKLTERIRSLLERYDGDPPESVQKDILEQLRKWNLIWVGRNKVAPMEPDEIEMLLGFPKNHTRGGGISRTDRYKSLGNSFQVDTVAYHLSVLKEMYPNGLNVLSLFSGIGGAEVALHRLGIKLNNVVSIEKSKVNRDILSSWWDQTGQTGNLRHYDDVQQFDDAEIMRLMEMMGGGFDLVVGGSPCNNLAGSNRVSRDGLEGTESSLFYDYFRILGRVRALSRE